MNRVQLEQLERAQQRMEQKWYNLVTAEQRGESVQALERLYNAYVLAMEEYNRCMEASQPVHNAMNAQHNKLAS